MHRFPLVHVPFMGVEAAATWQWHNFYVLRKVPPGKAHVRINLDETSICLFQGDSKGAVLIDKRQGVPLQNVPRARRRCCMTHVAFVCDSADLQVHLPQVIIGNESTFKVASMPALRAACPPCVHLVRQRSAWNNASMCAAIIKVLSDVLKLHAGDRQPILYLDAVRLHFAPEMLAACTRAGIWMVLVPAKMTWLLQPLDTHVFLLFKACLRRAYQNARIEGETSDLDIAAFLECVYHAIATAMNARGWEAAFDEVGFGAQQSCIAASVKRALKLPAGAPVVIPAARPTEDQLAMCFPKRARIPARIAAGGAAPRAPRPALARLAAGVAAPTPITAVGASPPVRSGREPRTRAEWLRARKAASVGPHVPDDGAHPTVPPSPSP